MSMRRAVGTLLLAALIQPLAPAPASLAHDDHGPGMSTIDPLKVTSINGIGMVDYGGKPRFKVGGWVKYRISAKSELGVSDDYTVTLLIAGEEEFWGDPAFWVETVTEHASGMVNTSATLMSYAIFDDSLAIPHMQLYMRKTIQGLDDFGRPKQELTKRPTSSLTQRKPIANRISWDVDTLEAASVTAAGRTFATRRVKIEQGIGVDGQSRDSLSYTEVREVRNVHHTFEVPITHVALEEIDYGMWRKTWKTGFSRDAGPLMVMDRSLGRAELVGFGHGGLEARMVPPEVRKTIAEQRRTKAAAASTRPKRSATR